MPESRYTRAKQPEQVRRALLDHAAAIAMVHKSDPFPTPPAALTEDRIERTVPIIFKPPDKKKKKKTAQRQ